MSESQLTESGTNWREQIAYYQVLLEKAQTDLIEAEAQLADLMAAINQFEFKLRSKVSSLFAKLETLDKEIKELRRKLSWRWEDTADSENGRSAWSMRDVGNVVGGAGATASGEYRYMEEMTTPATETADSATLKQLYRQLARRFHPDLALDEADRTYRTHLMIAINAAYATGDLAKLQALALEPDTTDHPNYAQTDQQLAEALQQELARCHRRLEEIKRELEKLEKHESTRLMRRAEIAEAEEHDWLAEITAQLRNKIARKTAERDMLHDELEYTNGEDADYQDDDFADAVFDLSLEDIYDEDPTTQAAEWLSQQGRWRERSDWDEETDGDDFLAFA